MTDPFPLPDILRNSWIGPVQERFVSELRDLAERLPVLLIHDLVEAGRYTIDPGHIARGVLAAAISARRH
jgi:hypothetical protein